MWTLLLFIPLTHHSDAGGTRHSPVTNTEHVYLMFNPSNSFILFICDRWSNTNPLEPSWVTFLGLWFKFSYRSPKQTNKKTELCCCAQLWSHACCVITDLPQMAGGGLKKALTSRVAAGPVKFHSTLLKLDGSSVITSNCQNLISWLLSIC